MASRELVVTEDGSHTFFIPGTNVSYHSSFGAMQESRHVYLEAGFNFADRLFNEELHPVLKVLEVGLGTGLNAMLSFYEAIGLHRRIYYYGIEPYPLSQEQVTLLNYPSMITPGTNKQLFGLLHSSPWNTDILLHPQISFHKSNIRIETFSTPTQFHLIYYDAFDPVSQPEVWETAIFENLYECLMPGGILVTYCSKGNVRRTLESVGFAITKLPGPRGKREIVRGVKR